MKLQPIFNIADLTYSSTAIAKGIDNSLMTTEQLTYLQELHAFLVALQVELCKEYHTVVIININSAFRSLELNNYFIKTIKASKTSQHMDGQASDTFCTGITLNQYFEALKKFAKNKTFTFGQVIMEFGSHPEKNSDDWIHISTSHNGHVNQFMTRESGKPFQNIKL